MMLWTLISLSIHTDIFAQCGGSQINGGQRPGCTTPRPGFPGNPNPIDLREVNVFGGPKTQPTGGWKWKPVNLKDLIGGSGSAVPLIYIHNQKIETNRPCPGDIVKDPQLTPSGGWNYRGGTYGYTRTQNGQPKFHDGIDITTVEGTDVYLSHTGVVLRKVTTFDRNYVSSSYGNILEIEFNDGSGNTYKLLYGHLSSIDSSIEVGKTYTAGTMFGKSGISGNAGLKNDRPQNGVIPHVHIRARKNNEKFDPANLLNTKFDPQTGKVLNPNPCKK